MLADDWLLRPAVSPPPEIIALTGGDPLAAQLLVQRGLTDPAAAHAFLDPACYTPAPPAALLGVPPAVELLVAAIRHKRRILVWGDFDVDGQTATALLVSALRSLSAPDRIDFHVPNRLTDGHGIRVEALKARLSSPHSAPELLVTCDTGIDEGPAIGYAKDNGLQVIVTDHHDLTPEFLDPSLTPATLWGQRAALVGGQSVRRADVVVNPKLLPAGDPLRTLPGVGVAYKLIQALFAALGRTGDERHYLDLVALGIVADVAEQVHDTRYLLQLGLQQLRATRRVGLLALMEVARLTPSGVDAESIGFQLGPRLNAVGRLEDAGVAVELLTTTDATRAGQLAAKLERLNQQRRILTSQIAASAMDLVARNPHLLDAHVLVLSHPAWHPGIVGIVAARLTAEYNKPVVMLITAPGEPARGSARSVPGVDIGASVAACSRLLLTHGGHPGAAGLSLLPENIEHFRSELSRQIAAHRTDELPPSLVVDAILAPDQLTLAFAEQLSRLGPFGNGNPVPHFMSTNLTVANDRRLSRDGAHRRLTLRDAAGAPLEVLWFRGADAELPPAPLDLVYTLSVNQYQGERTLQLIYVAARPTHYAPVESDAPAHPALTIHDLRGDEPIASTLPSGTDVIWYAEGAGLEQGSPAVPYAPRTQLASAPHPGATLVIWSEPPASDLLAWLISSARPATLYLCAHPTADDSLDGLLRHVAGMCKYALQHDSLLHIDRMAARLGTTGGVIRHALLWLATRGLIVLQEWRNADAVAITAGTNQPTRADTTLLEAQLSERLAEVRAYRRYYRRARLADLGLTVPARPKP